MQSVFHDILMSKVMSFFRKTNFFDTIEPFFIFIKVFGCAGFQLRTQEFQNTLLDHIFCLVNFSVGLFTLYTSFIPRFLMDSLVLSISVQIGFYLIVSSSLLVFLINFLNRRKFHQLLKQFYAFDIEVSKNVSEFLRTLIKRLELLCNCVAFRC